PPGDRGPWTLEGLLRTVHFVVIAAVVLALGCEQGAVAGDARVSFNGEVRPILSDSCYRCHGPDAGNRKAGLRLDRREDATRALPSGAVAVVPGDPNGSDLLARVTADDPTERMPPPKSGQPLVAAQVTIFCR